MQINIMLVIIIALVCMFFGYFFGLFEGRSQGNKKRKAEDEAGQQENPHQAATAPAPVVFDDPGLLRLREDNGSFGVELDGAPVQVDAVAPEQRKRLIELITRVRPWVEGRQTSSAPAAQPFPVSTPVSVPVSQPLSAGRTLSNTSPVTVKKEEPAAPKTMVGQIDAILQDKLVDTALARRGIKLEESASGGVTVVVGINRYPGLGDVPDPDVQAAIRAAIAEWERKFTPGI